MSTKSGGQTGHHQKTLNALRGKKVDKTVLKRHNITDGRVRKMLVILRTWKRGKCCN